MNNPADIGARIAQLVADAANGLHRVNGAFVAIDAKVTGGVITLDVCEIDFVNGDRTVRMILQPSTPVPIEQPEPDPPATSQVDPVVNTGTAA